MSKQKTHSGAKKRFRMTGAGALVMARSRMRHGMRKRPNDMKSKGICVLMDKSDAPRISKQLLPYKLK